MFVNDQVVPFRFVARRRLGQAAAMPTVADLVKLVPSSQYGPTTGITVYGGAIGEPSTRYRVSYPGGTDSTPEGAVYVDPHTEDWGAAQMEPYISLWQRSHAVVAVTTTSAPTPPAATTTTTAAVPAGAVSQQEFTAYVQASIAQQRALEAELAAAQQAPSAQYVTAPAPQYTAPPGPPAVSPADQQRGAMPVVVSAAALGGGSWWGWLLALVAGGIVYYLYAQPEPRRRRVRAAVAQPTPPGPRPRSSASRRRSAQ